MAKISSSFDWRDKKVISDVRHQATDDCTVQTVAATIEEMIMIRTGKKVTISRQQLIDNTMHTNTDGVNFSDVLEWIKINGVCEESEYRPYVGNIGLKPENSDGKTSHRIHDYRVWKSNDSTLEQAVRIQPVALTMYVGDLWQSYGKWMMYYGEANQENVAAHAVEVVGFTPAYWIVKNSYGVGWGVEGYAYVWRRKENPNGTAGMHIEDVER